MTRADRIRAACERFAEGPPEGHAETVDEGIEAALDAALADVGGLDGLDARLREDALEIRGLYDDLHTAEGMVNQANADRDRLREALRRFTGSGDIALGAGVDDLRRRLEALDQTARNVLRDSEAGT